MMVAERLDLQGRLAPRYRIDAEVGQGAFGVVYRAFDSERREEVALKVLRSTSAEDIQQLKHEFRAARDLRHPNLVALRELIDDGELCYFTMSAIDGEPLIRWLGARCLNADYQEVLAPLFAQLADGLAALHRTAVVHRDLSPHNILVTKDGRPVIIDLGLSSSLTSPHSLRSRVGTFTGTPGYAAPEQAQGRDLTTAADMFALGVLLHEALTGKRPFTPLVISQAHLLPEGFVAPPIVGELGALATELLSLDPAARPDAASVAARLRGLTPRSQAKLDVCVGRDRELAALAAHERDPAVDLIIIEGPSGIGKSHLLRHFLSTLEHQGSVVLRGRCHPREQVAFNAFDALIDELVRYLRRSPIRVPARHVTPLATVFPGFRALELTAERAPERGLALQTLAFDALAELFHELAHTYRLVLCIEDWHWADEDSVRLLTSLRGGPWTVLLTRRTESSVNGSTHIEGSTRLALGVLDEHGQVELGRILTPRAVTIAGGHPLLAQVAERALARAENKSAPRDLTEVFASLVGELDEDTRALLELLVVAGAPTPLEVLAKAHPRPERLDDAAEELIARALARWDGSSTQGGRALGVFHELVGARVEAKLSQEARRELHGRLLDAHRESPSPDAAALIHHALGSDRREDALELAFEGAQRALEGLAFGRAAELYRVAQDLAPSGSEPQKRAALERAEALVADGRCIAAAQVMVAVLEAPSLSPTGVERLRLMARAAEYFLRGGGRAEGLDLARKTLEEAEIPWRSGTMSTLANLLWGRFAIGMRARRRPGASRAERVPFELEVLWSVSSGLSFYDSLRAFELGVRHMRLSERVGDPLNLARAYSTEATLAAMTRGLPATAKAQRLQSLARGHAARHGTVETRSGARSGYVEARGGARSGNVEARGGARSGYVEAHLEFMATTQAYALGQYAVAFERAQRGLGLCDALGPSTQWERGGLAFTAAGALGKLGRFDAQREFVKAAMKQAARVDDRYQQMMLAVGPAALHELARGAPEVALDAANEARKSGGDNAFLDYMHAFLAGRALLMMGEPERARSLVREGWRKIWRGGMAGTAMVRAEMLALLARCELATSERDRAAMGRARRLQRKLARVHHPTATSQSLALGGLIASLRGDETLAHESWVSAQQSFEAFGESHEAMVMRMAAERRDPATIHAWLRGEGISDPQRWLRILAVPDR